MAKVVQETGIPPDVVFPIPVADSDNQLYTALRDYFARLYDNLTNIVSVQASTTSAINGTYTVSADDGVLLCDGTFTVTLPVAADSLDSSFYIKNIGSGTITVSGDGSETIDESNTIDLIQHEVIQVVCDGSEWWII